MGYRQNEEITYIPNHVVRENSFIGRTLSVIDLPSFADIREKLPVPHWSGHPTTIDCYYKAWEIAFVNIKNPQEGTKFVSPFIDAAFNGDIFMWDTVFMLMFGKYAHDIFDFQKSLDNFYAHQHADGYICRQISEADSTEVFTRFDPSSTGPNLMPWCEWEYYLLTGDTERIKDVFPPLLAYHRWLRKHRTWPGGGYFTSGWGCGMDNQPRLPDLTQYESWMFDHGHMIWVDTTMQQIISCRVLLEMAEICGRRQDVGDMEEEFEKLKKLVNEKLWDEDSKYYYDRWQDDRLNHVKSVAGYWALLAEIVPEERIAPFVAHLENEKEFKRPHRVPTLSADHPAYRPEGEYWRGSIWAPTNYMVLRGLRRNGYETLAHEIAMNSLDNVIRTYEATGTLWENYAPESAAQGCESRPNFVGWSGLFPISILFEYVFGIDARVDQRELVWNIRLTEEFGVERLPLGTHGKIDLYCAARNHAEEKPVIRVRSDEDLTLILRWGDQEETVRVKGTKN